MVAQAELALDGDVHQGEHLRLQSRPALEQGGTQGGGPGQQCRVPVPFQRGGQTADLPRIAADAGKRRQPPLDRAPGGGGPQIERARNGAGAFGIGCG